jgi:GTP-binding protein
MRFVDEVVIHVQGGAGGNGCLAFRREAHVPRGGPSGGDGGDGGAVILEADPSLTTLLDLRYQRHYRADRGQHGQGHDRHGRGAGDRVVRVPCGTLIFDRETGEQLADLVDPGQRFVAARGGQGGWGNRRFVSPTNRAPRRADPGEPGEERDLRLELRLLADVGLVGLPNAGKSTLVARVSAARPRIADYPFTTLVPSLGLVRLGDEQSFVMADIPGLIEGASGGAGLGHRFLRHIERTAVLVYLVDDRHALCDEPGSALDDLAILRRELEAHDPELAGRPAVVALSKIDLLPDERREVLCRDLAAHGVPVVPVSAVTGAGVEHLLRTCWGLLHDPDGEQAHPARNGPQGPVDGT